MPERGDCALRDVALGMEPASGAQLALPARLRHAVPASMQVRLRLWHRSRALRHGQGAPLPTPDSVERSRL